METILRPFSPAIPSITANRFATPSKAPLFSSPKTRFSLSTTTQHRVSTGKFGNFLDLIPDSQPQSLDVDLPWFHHPDRPSFDVVVIGAGPAGLRLAEQVSALGIKVCCIDPSLLSSWPNNYGVWVDEFEKLAFDDCLDKTWPMTCVFIDDFKTKYLDRPYGDRQVHSALRNGARFDSSESYRLDVMFFLL